ncbi:S8 family peptidase [Sphaerisporangium corydalis]|uniref:S8 family peptidase n=1 Tax=Sphaerisporangium corydalis TaxID=1441875 RepID=A0ABV9ES46_9ACTN|nr:S8 family peptidase [Sphaerisporangium corydalis]
MAALLGIILLGSLAALAPVARSATPGPASPLTRTTGPPPPRLILDQYIVSLRPKAPADRVIAVAGVRPIYRYTRVINGFTAHMTPPQVVKLLTHPDVASIEQDGAVQELEQRAPTPPSAGSRDAARPATVAASGRSLPTTSWGLDRIDQRNLPLNGSFNVTEDGTGVTAYMVGSGIDPVHTQFTGRLLPGYTAINDGRGTGDCLGQGTLIAGIAGGTTWGVARNIRLSPIRVLGCQGHGSYSGLIAGLDWVAAHAKPPAVANISIGGAKSFAVNNAANALSRLGVFIVAAAGDFDGDACDVSPAAALEVLGVAASTIHDTPALVSDSGRCVNLFAPGVDIISAGTGGGARRASGSAYASPYVTGVAALFLQTHTHATPYAVFNWLTANATTGVLRDLPAGTPNKLLYTGGL